MKALLPNIETRLHYIGVDIPEVPSQAGRSDDQFTVLAVSRLHPVKGVDRSIKAFAKAFKGAADVTMQILGDGPELSRLQRLVSDEGLLGQVGLVGRVEHRRALESMQSASVMVQHSVPLPTGAEEALGLSLVEAAAAGLPIVATNTGGIPEVVLDGQTGYLVKPGDADAMADRLRALRESASLRARLGIAGSSHVGRVMNAAVQDTKLREILGERAASRTRSN